MNELYSKAMDLSCRIGQMQVLLNLVANYGDGGPDTITAVFGIAELANQAQTLSGEIEAMANKPAGMVDQLQGVAS